MVEGARRFDAGLVLATIWLLASLGTTLTTLRASSAVDFYHFWLVGQAVQAGEVIDVYAPDARRDVGERAYRRAMAPSASPALRRAATKFRHLETTGTPFLYASFFPFVGSDYDRDRIVFNAASLLLFLGALGGVAGRLGYGPTAIVAAMGFALAAFEPLASDLRVGNVNRLQFALLAVWAALLWGLETGARGRALLAGAWMGLAMSWKPNLAFAAVAVVGDWGLRDRGAAFRFHLLGLVAGGLSALVVSSAFFATPRIWLWWAEAALDLPHDFPIPVEEGNFAPLRVLRQLFGVDLGPAWTVACLVGLGLVLRRAAVGVRSDAGPLAGARVVLLIGLGCGVSLLAAPLAWLHYYLLSLFLVLWVLRPSPPGRPRSIVHRAVGVLAAVCVSMGPVLQLFVASGPYRWAALANVGLLALLGLAGADLLRTGTTEVRRVVAPPAASGIAG